MKFISNGPNIPDELLLARDAGDVILFCGAGISQAEAKLPNFADLGQKVINALGAAQDSRARALLKRALELKPMPGVGGLVATDRVFGLLEREFEVADVRAAVAAAIEPASDAKLDAHRVLLDLATSRGVTRLVTTNFDLLFEACDPTLPSYGPPNLPDPHSDRDFRGVVHLHGRVDAQYRRAQDDEFVVSSADFGRAYLSIGWATHFIQRLLSRFQILFIGYSADDPPMQYLLEGLNLKAGTQNRLYALQDGEHRSAIALWEHRGVQAIPFDSSNGFSPLWDSLRAWAERARDNRAWYGRVLSRATMSPELLTPHERGQVAHLLLTNEGAKKLTAGPERLGSKWLLVADPAQRYAEPKLYTSANDDIPFEPFDALSLDSDPPPEPTNREDVFRKREIPSGAIDIFAPNILDHGRGEHSPHAMVHGPKSQYHAELSPRLVQIGIWLRQVAHEPTALWWAAHQSGLHPSITRDIDWALLHQSQRFPDHILRQWRLLLSAWADQREDPSMRKYRIEQMARQEGWTASLVREVAALYRPKLNVKPSSGIPHPLAWTDKDRPDDIVHVDVDYPHPHQRVELPDEFVAYGVQCFRTNLELAITLEQEISGNDWLYLQTSRAIDGGPELLETAYGLTGPVIHFQNLMARLMKLDINAAREQAHSWPSKDEHVFARLRIWATGAGLLPPGEVFLGLSDRVFWGSVHKRDLLYAVRDRWADLSQDDREALERRILTGSYPWDVEISGGYDEENARERLDRLHWLSTHGVKFTFDLHETMQTLRSYAPRWTTNAGDEAAASNAPEVFSVATDTRPDPILETPPANILRHAEEVGGLDFSTRAEREPFRGLVDLKPVLALRALSHEAQSGAAPRWAWSAFLRPEVRSKDPIRMIRAIAGRLERLPPEALRNIAYPVSEWMKAISGRLYSDASGLLPALWDRMMTGLKSSPAEHRHRVNRSWADDALNAPVGKLFDFLLKDPAKDGIRPGAGFPSHWTTRIDDLLALPGDMRRHALVMLGFQINWLFTIDPYWTERQLLAHVGDNGPDGDAIWDGMLWAGRPPMRSLYPALKDALLTRTLKTKRRSENTNLASFLLFGWANQAPTGEKLLTDIELREVLIHTDDDFRQQLLWQLERWCVEPDSSWRERVIPFFSHVWPKQRALRTPFMSGHLANFALAVGDLMPAVVELIVPRLVPIRNTPLRFEYIGEASDIHPARGHPVSTLDLLWAVLGEDASTWPYQIESALDLLAQASETALDSRLSELRRRMDLS
ncbi:SIR2 family protein [Microvirga sp. ACRRW]|uniref:SIR2 family protein n=1 Tax=Microvirga sp. ACRRW TaxID=2918205 RepID=UPI001EF6AEA6|nr:SIR2 family protein [Microvirga sp. ACRRW]MCG7394235.1 SIR2 family protein [Microvirga sp. ACRRW]